MRKITATEAARNFSDILNRVKYNGEEFVVERNGEVVRRIVPPLKPQPPGMTGKEFAEWWRNAPKPDPEFWDDVEWAIKNQPKLPLEDRTRSSR
jgi:antitoxin (DNA-binding transcriptional repressor) of toxin-antitoxin stability system